MDLQEVVLHDVASRPLERLDEAERRLLAKRSGEDDPRLIHGNPIGCSLNELSIGAEHLRRRFDGDDETRAQDTVQLARRDPPRLFLP